MKEGEGGTVRQGGEEAQRIACETQITKIGWETAATRRERGGVGRRWQPAGRAGSTQATAQLHTRVSPPRGQAG